MFTAMLVYINMIEAVIDTHRLRMTHIDYAIELAWVAIHQS